MSGLWWPSRGPDLVSHFFNNNKKREEEKKKAASQVGVSAQACITRSELSSTGVLMAPGMWSWAGNATVLPLDAQYKANLLEFKRRPAVADQVPFTRSREGTLGGEEPDWHALVGVWHLVDLVHNTWGCRRLRQNLHFIMHNWFQFFQGTKNDGQAGWAQELLARQAFKIKNADERKQGTRKPFKLRTPSSATIHMLDVGPRRQHRNIFTCFPIQKKLSFTFEDPFEKIRCSAKGGGDQKK